MMNATEPVGNMSRDLREPLRRLRLSLATIVEGSEVINEWVQLIDGSGVECPGKNAG